MVSPTVNTNKTNQLLSHLLLLIVMVKLSIGQKSLLLFLIISLFPIAVINTYWLKSEQATLRRVAAEGQTTLTESRARQLNEYMRSLINTTILHSQTNSVQKKELHSSAEELTTFILQNKDLERVALVDENGQELIVITKDGPNTDLQNVAGTDAFRAATFLSGKEYIGQVRFDNVFNPLVTIAVPLVSFETRQSLYSLSTAERGLIRSGQEIKGVLIVDVNLNNIFDLVFGYNMDTQGYSYLVDETGQLLAHPDSALMQQKPNLSQVEQVADYIQHRNQATKPVVTTSEKNIKVLSTHHQVENTRWAVITEEAVTSIFAPTDKVALTTLYIFAIFAIIATLLSIFFSRTLTLPIKKLVAGSSQMAEGNLDQKIDVKSKDEMGLLANRFNYMASNLKQYVVHLRAETAKLNFVLNSVGEGVIAIDGNQRITLANTAAAKLTESTTHELKGKSFNEVFSFLMNGSPRQLQLEKDDIVHGLSYTSPNRRLYYLDILISKITSDPTGITHIITIRDQTEERELEDMKLDFVSMAAHELRTPITSIRGYLSLILAEDLAETEGNIKHYVERAEFSSKQLAGLINNLLNVSKVERGSLSMNFVKVDWVQVVRDAVHDQQYNAGTKEISLEFIPPAEQVSLIVDEIGIREVLNNLLSNALNYTPHGGRVAVSIELAGDSVITSINDNGVGIQPNALKRLFTKFYRARSGLASGSGGTGLGLYLSKAIVELHHGKIWVESEFGKGATFTFSLPAFDEERYQELKTTEINAGVVNKRGWVTKNISR